MLARAVAGRSLAHVLDAANMSFGQEPSSARLSLTDKLEYSQFMRQCDGASPAAWIKPPPSGWRVTASGLCCGLPEE